MQVNRGKQQGLLYLALLFAVAIGAIAVAGQSSWWMLERQRDKERELLFAGDQFRRAIASYFHNSPGPTKVYPETLDALTWDTRVLPARQHLRRIYTDPVTSELKWGTVAASDGGVMGVYSLSKELPLKRAGFSQSDEDFTGKAHYDEWVFVYHGNRTRYVPPRMLIWQPPTN